MMESRTDSHRPSIYEADNSLRNNSKHTLMFDHGSRSPLCVEPVSHVIRNSISTVHVSKPNQNVLTWRELYPDNKKDSVYNVPGTAQNLDTCQLTMSSWQSHIVIIPILQVRKVRHSEFTYAGSFSS